MSYNYLLMKRSIYIFILIFSAFTIYAQTPDFALVGFGEGTTGGEGGTEVTVSNYTDLKTYAESTNKYIIYVNNTIQNGADGGKINVKSNKSIIGVGTSGFLFGVGLSISGVSNIIVRNLKISMTGVTTRTDKSGVYSSTGDEGRPQILTNGGDCIGIQGTSYNIWIDHCEFFSEDTYTQTNQDLYDGIVDIKNGSHNITISWNYIHDHHKVHLVGSADTDTGDRKITFHHNYYNNVKERLPLYRFGTAHIFNNYMYKCSSAVNSRMGACVYVEKNYFENVTSNTVYSSGSTTVGYATLADNYLVSSKATNIGTCSTFVPLYNYSSVLNNAVDVKLIVTTWAGVGKITNNPNAVNELSENKLQIIQNLTLIQIISNEQLDLSVFNLSGQLINKTSGNSMPINGLSSGIYFLHIKDGKTINQTTKFIVAP